MECEYLKIRKLQHNDGNESTTYKCDNPRSNRFEKSSLCKGMVCDTCKEKLEKEKVE